MNRIVVEHRTTARPTDHGRPPTPAGSWARPSCRTTPTRSAATSATTSRCWPGRPSSPPSPPARSASTAWRSRSTRTPTRWLIDRHPHQRRRRRRHRCLRGGAATSWCSPARPTAMDLIAVGSDTSGFLTAARLQTSNTVRGHLSEDTVALSNLSRFFSVNNGSFVVDGKTIAVTTADSIESIRDRINASGARVTAAFNASTNKLELTTGYNSEDQVAVGSDTSGFLAAASISAPTPSAATSATTSRCWPRRRSSPASPRARSPSTAWPSRSTRTPTRSPRCHPHQRRGRRRHRRLRRGARQAGAHRHEQQPGPDRRRRRHQRLSRPPPTC